MKRGEIFWANLDPVVGSEISKTRPVLIVSNDINNEYSQIAVVAAEKGYGPLMFELAMTHAPNHRIISDRDSTTSDAALNIFRGMDKRGLGKRTLDSSDKNYVKYNDKNDEDNRILNTIYSFDDEPTYQKLVKNAKEYLISVKDKEKFIKNLSERGFRYFSDKLDNAYN